MDSKDLERAMDTYLRRRDAQMSTARGWKRFAPESAKDIAPARVSFYTAMARANNREALRIKRKLAGRDRVEGLIEALTEDSLPGLTLGIHRNEGRWGVQQMMTHLEESYPTDIWGEGDTLEAALELAVSRLPRK